MLGGEMTKDSLAGKVVSDTSIAGETDRVAVGCRAGVFCFRHVLYTDPRGFPSERIRDYFLRRTSCCLLKTPGEIDPEDVEVCVVYVSVNHNQLSGPHMTIKDSPAVKAANFHFQVAEEKATKGTSAEIIASLANATAAKTARLRAARETRDAAQATIDTQTIVKAPEKRKKRLK
jgi:hypothetical protein